jgi:NAD(P)-dependent dehydrogenase (short-subunit alcohol dehydrogenase family)
MHDRSECEWTHFTRHFPHLKSGDLAKDRRLLLTTILADAINLGLTKMAESCPGMTYAKLAWLQAWHIRDEDRVLSFKENMLSKLTGKIAVITGGNSGIGLSTAEQFVAEGAYVYITGRRQAELDAAVARIGRNMTAVQGDVANMADLDRFYAQVSKEKGRIDILFANAGIANHIAPLGEITEDQFDKTFDVNVRGLLFSVQKALPLMPQGASIILNASTAASIGIATLSVYSASKAAVRSFARTWTSDLKERKIRVNVLSPGWTETPIFKTLNWSEEHLEEARATYTPTIPMGRWARSEETARAAVFLASDDSSYVTGIELLVDGGLTAV